MKSQAEQPNDFNNYTEYMSTAKLPESVVRAFTQQRIIPKLLEQGRRSFWGVQQEKNDAKAVGLYMHSGQMRQHRSHVFSRLVFSAGK